MSTGPIRRGLSFLLALIFTCYLLPLQAYADERTASQAEADRARAAYDVAEGDFSSNTADAEKSELISVYNATKRAAASPTCSNRPYPHLRGGGGMVMMYA